MDALELTIGLIVVTVGAELLVRGASRVAVRLGVASVVVGLTVVAMGTSAPEVAISLLAVSAGRADLGVGNVVGSNVFNVLFILGASALITPLVVARRLVRIDVPIMIGASLVTLIMAFDGTISRFEGVVLSLALVAYVSGTVYQARREHHDGPSSGPDVPGPQGKGRTGSLAYQIVLIVVGLVLLTLGARFLVNGASGIAQSLGLSELVIGLTIVAAGTSVPEVATSLVAAYRGERDLAVGNAVGSSIFNLLFVLGTTALFARGGIPIQLAALHFDLPIMLATAVACLPIFFTGYCIDRWEGVLLFGYYIAYVAYLVLDAARHDATHAFGGVMLFFALPLTAVTLVVVTVRAWRARNRGPAVTGP